MAKSYFLKVPEEFLLLDEILKSLFNSEGRSKLIQTLTEELYNEPLGKEIQYKFGVTDEKPDKIPFTEKLIVPAIEYLSEQGLVIYYPKDTSVRLKYSGIVKHLKGGFSQEFKDENSNKNLQRIFWLSAPIALLISLFSIGNQIFHWF